MEGTLSPRSDAPSGDWQERLATGVLRREVTHHPFLERIARTPLTRAELEFFLGQWHHLLVTFSPFLAGTISRLSSPKAQTFLAQILFQELGEGDPSRAHLALFVETAVAAGLDRSVIVGSPPLDTTSAWVRGHRRAADEGLTGLGFVYGTEKVDLPMVTAVGRAIKLTTLAEHLPWVEIHQSQEPAHVNMVDSAVRSSLSAEEGERVVSAAHAVWRLWRDFFTGVEAKLAGGSAVVGAPRSDEENIAASTSSAGVDALNARFYGRFTYPWRAATLHHPADSKVALAMRNQDFGDWEHRTLREDARIWVAGCGTNQAVCTALQFPNARILGTDLSQESLDICAATARSVGCDNLQLERQSINLASYRDEFDLVICTGVIHHNSDPEGTLARLGAAVKPRGVIELMVYNRFHRILSSTVQKAIRLLSSHETEDDPDSMLQIAKRVVASFPARNLMADFLAGLSGRPEAMVADTLLQPVEYSYTVESVGQLVHQCGLEILAHCLNEHDKAAGRLDWNLRWRDDDLQASYDALPDVVRWQVSNLLLLDESPMLWFYLQRRDSGRPIKSEAQLAEEFLAGTFDRVEPRQRYFVLQSDGSYQRAPREVTHAHAEAGSCAERLWKLADGHRTMRELFESVEVEPRFPAVHRARLTLATSAFPFLSSNRSALRR